MSSSSCSSIHTMKLRLRSIKNKETLTIEVPTTCSLQHLKYVVSQRSSSSSSSPASVHLSLNQRDELFGSSPQESLQTLGVTSGDLIFFSFNPNDFSSETLIVQSQCNSQEPNSTQPQNSRETLTLEPNSQKKRTLDDVEEDQTQVLNAQKEETLDSESGKCETEPRKDQTLGLDTQNPGMSGTENMDIDEDGPIVEVGKSFSMPCFLRKVFRKEVGDGGDGDHKLLVTAVHVILLESGFIAFDSVSKSKIEGFHFPDEWPSSTFAMSLSYTLPEIIVQGPSAVETVVLKFQRLGKYVNIYGYLAKNGCGPYHVCLDEDHLVSLLHLTWASCDSIDEITGKDRFSNMLHEREVFEFWKTVKDRLALPLLIDLCEKAGLAPPPCFMRLPTDLTLKILESLPGVDVAKVGCVCSKLRYLSSNDDLWKQKVVEQFGNAEGSQGGSHWKEKFAKSWETWKRNTAIWRRLRYVMLEPCPYRDPRIIGDPYLFGVPIIIGRDYGIIEPDFPPLGWPA